MNLGSVIGPGWARGAVPALCCPRVEWGLSEALGPEDKDSRTVWNTGSPRVTNPDGGSEPARSCFGLSSGPKGP